MSGLFSSRKNTYEIHDFEVKCGKSQLGSKNF